jgi:hypothetical protein
MSAIRKAEPAPVKPVAVKLAAPILDARALTPIRDMFALQATNGARYYADVVAEKGADSTVVRHIERQANHHATFFRMMRAGREAGLTKEESLRQFKDYWYGEGPDTAALEEAAQKAYGVSYASLCCDRKRAVAASVAAAKAKPLEAAQSPRRANIPRRGY